MQFISPDDDIQWTSLRGRIFLLNCSIMTGQFHFIITDGDIQWTSPRGRIFRLCCCIRPRQIQFIIPDGDIPWTSLRVRIFLLNCHDWTISFNNYGCRHSVKTITGKDIFRLSCSIMPGQMHFIILDCDIRWTSPPLLINFEVRTLMQPLTKACGASI